ncbi:unnamed protein product, partial [Allacma fusca]
FQQKVRKAVSELDPQTLHLMLDMWTDREKNSVMGIKAQFISKNWKINNLVLGFRHFTSHHDSIAIRNMFNSVLKNSYKVDPVKVGFAVGDNASNVKAAFGRVDPLDMQSIGIQTEADIPPNGDSDDEWEDFEEFFEIDSNSDDDNFALQKDLFKTAERGLDKWATVIVPKLPCYCHLLQLAVKDSLEANSNISALVKDVKKVKKFFHASPYWYNKFKVKAGKGLVNQADTRGNTVCFVFERLVQFKIL